ncbi:MAG: galactokinase family protein, partial [Christensenellales bacterium]
MDIRQALENAEKLFPGGKARYEKILANFYSFFGNAADIHLISAPGRVEIGGNHTDHQRGCVLAAAVNLDIMGACAKNGLNEIRILSEGYPLISVSLENLSVREADRNTSAALVRGIAEQYGRLYAKNGGPGGAFPPLGFDACVQSDIPAGSGVSSSGAFEVFIAACMNHLFFGGKISPEEMAQMGRYAENIHFGKPSGLMDQMTCATGGLVFIDFSAGDGAPFVKKLRAQVSGHALCIIEAGDSHEDLTADYAAIT